MIMSNELQGIYAYTDNYFHDAIYKAHQDIFVMDKIKTSKWKKGTKMHIKMRFYDILPSSNSQSLWREIYKRQANSMHLKIEGPKSKNKHLHEAC